MPASSILIRCPQDAGVVPHRVHVVPHSVEMQIGRVPEVMTWLSTGDDRSRRWNENEISGAGLQYNEISRVEILETCEALGISKRNGFVLITGISSQNSSVVLRLHPHDMEQPIL